MLRHVCTSDSGRYFLLAAASHGKRKKLKISSTAASHQVTLPKHGERRHRGDGGQQHY
jgi:hypothetical protein